MGSGRWTHDRLGAFARPWAEREFGPAYASDIADILAKYTKYSGRRKPDLLEPETFSLVNYGEADRIVAEWQAITAKAEAIYRALPDKARDAFFQLVLYPAKGSAQVAELYIAAGRNRLYAEQGRAAANDLASRVRELFRADADLSWNYNHVMANGKWDHMMDQTHIGYTSWNDPPSNPMPEVREIEIPREAKMEAAHFTSKTAAPDARWEEIADYGRTLSSMTVFPASILPQHETPALEYRMYLFDSGTIKVNATVAPTLNFVPGRGLRFAVSFDDQPPQVVDALAQNTQKDWETSVKDSVRVVTSTHHLNSPGYHVLKIRMVDPGIVLQKIVVDPGGVKPSYLGPPESYHRF